MNQDVVPGIVIQLLFLGLFTMAAKGFDQLPLLRQIGLLFGLAGSIALGFSVVLWMQEPNFRPLFSNLSSADTSQVIDKLQQAGI